MKKSTNLPKTFSKDFAQENKKVKKKRKINYTAKAYKGGKN